MRIGYFSHSSLTVSETFIYDLVKDLSADEELDLTYYSGLYKGEVSVDFDLKFVATGFHEKGERRSFFAHRMGQLLSGRKGFKFKMAMQKFVSIKMLLKTVKAPIDIAYVDYANSAILLKEFFILKKIPFIVHVHGFDITASLNDPEYVKELKGVLENARFLVTASEYMKRLLVLQGADESKIRVIRYGIDVESIKPLSWEVRLKSDPSVIFLGRLTEKKHPIALLYAFKIVLEKVPNAKLTIIGDGPLKSEVIERIKTLNMEKSVFMMGSLPREKSFPIMNNHWVFAQHSVTAKSGDQEGYALSPAEAAAHELPVVSTIHNGIPEHVIDGKTGYLVPEFNYEMMAEKIIYLLQNPEVAEKMGKAGRINIEGLNDQKTRVASIKSVLGNAIKNNS